MQKTDKVLFLAVYCISCKVADDGNHHTVDGCNTPMYQVGNNCSQHNTYY